MPSPIKRMTFLGVLVMDFGCDFDSVCESAVLQETKTQIAHSNRYFDIFINNYFNTIDSIGTSINVASLIGHNTIRKQAMGTANRNATAAEMQTMEKLAAEAMRDGAVGMSTGLIYIPGTYAPTEEIVSLAQK